VLTLLTDDPQVARAGVEAGIDRIGLDLEILGKEERQGGRATRISAHSIGSLAAIRDAIGTHPLFVRINPLHPGSESEIEGAIAGGATHVMLPYFHSVEDAARFSAMVRGRAHAILLVETAAAVYYIEELVAIPGIGGIHVGLTDLKLSFGIPARFETLASWIMDGVAKAVIGAGLELHVGGIARCDDPGLPVPSGLINAQFPRLGATGALVSRAFLYPQTPLSRLAAEIRRFRDEMNRWGETDPEELVRQRRALEAFIRCARARGQAMP
jgi:hypothetical protein